MECAKKFRYSLDMRYICYRLKILLKVDLPLQPFCNVQLPWQPFCNVQLSWQPFCNVQLSWQPFCNAQLSWQPFCNVQLPWQPFCNAKLVSAEQVNLSYLADFSKLDNWNIWHWNGIFKKRIIFCLHVHSL